MAQEVVAGGQLALALDRPGHRRRSRRRWRGPRPAEPPAARAAGAPRAPRRSRRSGSPVGCAAARAGTSSAATKIPPDWPRRTSSTPASVRVLIASRSVGPADPHLGGQLALGGQPVAGVQVAGLDLLGDLLDGLLEGPASRDGLEGLRKGQERRVHRLPASTRSSAWRSATSSGVRPSAAALAIARSRLSIALAMRACSGRRRRRRTTRPRRGSGRRSWRGSRVRRGRRAPSGCAPRRGW